MWVGRRRRLCLHVCMDVLICGLAEPTSCRIYHASVLGSPHPAREAFANVGRVSHCRPTCTLIPNHCEGLGSEEIKPPPQIRRMEREAKPNPFCLAYIFVSEDLIGLGLV